MKVIDRDEVILNGRYLVTDPCYVYGGDGWDEFCKLLWADKQQTGGGITLFEIDGKEVPVMSTRYGDGGYPVVQDGEFAGMLGVDAGLFCFIPWGEEQITIGTIVELQGKLTYHNGDAFIDDNVVVDTSGESFEDKNYD